MQPTDVKMNYFNYLPPEIIVIIFKELNLNDLFNLKSVDKRFKEISEQIKITELYVHSYLTDIKLYSKLQLWFYTNDLTYFDKENIIDCHLFLYYKTELQLDRNLKRLTIYIEEDTFNLSSLNEFKLLENLSIFVLDCNGDCDCELNLENLKIFEITWCVGGYSKLILNTNKLFAFKSINMKFDNIVFKYPDKILFYETDNPSYDDKISILNNLQYLKLTHLYNPIDRDILSKFKKLKTLDFEQYYSGGEIRFNNLKNDINFLINQKENLKRSELQIYFNGVKLIDQNKLNQLKWSSNKFSSDLLEFQIKNYDLLKDNCCSYMNRINYCDLIKLIQIIPSTFMNKFQCIKKVEANDHIGNEDQFIKFLNDLPYLTILKLVDCELNKSFYQKLINLVYLNNLDELKIEEKKDLKINFNFIVNLKQLRFFSTNQEMNDIDSVCKLFKINGDICEFFFKINSKNHIEIVKKDSGKFRIDSYYLDYNLKKVENPSINNLELKDLKSKLENLKIE